MQITKNFGGGLKMENIGFLFQLVSSMTKGEKRVFRQQSKVQQGKKDYVALFNHLSRIDQYDETRAMRKLSWDKTPQQYYNLKNYLFRYLLKTLNLVYEGPGAKVENNIRYIKILMQRNLFAAGEKILHRTLDRARREERFTECIQLADLLKRIIQEKEETRKFSTELREVRQFRSESRVLQDNLEAYEALNDRFYIYTKTTYIARGHYELAPLHEIEKNQLLSDPSLALSNRAKFFFHKIKYTIALFSGEYGEALYHCKQCLALFEEHDFLKEDLFQEYYGSLSNLGHLQLLLGRYEKCRETLRTLVATELPVWVDIDELSDKKQLLQLRYSIETGNVQQGYEAAVAIEEWLKKADPKIKPSKRMLCNYQLATFYLIAGEPRKAGIWTRKVIDEPRTNVRSDLQSFARILNLFIYFDLGDTDLLDYYSRSTYRFLYSRKKLYKYEHQILSFIKKAPNLLDKSQLRALFQEEIDTLTELFENPFEKQASYYFDTISWLRSKLEKRNLAEVIKERNLERIKS